MKRENRQCRRLDITSAPPRYTVWSHKDQTKLFLQQLLYHAGYLSMKVLNSSECVLGQEIKLCGFFCYQFYWRNLASSGYISVTVK